MTVVSIVFAILPMTLTLASMQFSPRILISFVRDQGTQWTLGIFLGTFTYCLAALPAARSMPQPFAPLLTVLGAMLLAPVSVGWLMYLRVRVTRRVGHFVPAGIPLLMVSRRTRLDRHHAVDLTGAFDIGPMRTLQQDVEFGVIQIVDIALRAISPAVNDPSTAIRCIDQLTRILIRWVDRIPPESLLFSPPHVVRVVLPWIDRDGLLNTAIEQIRAYATTDAAVSLRLLRLLHDVAISTDDQALRRRLAERGARVVAGCRGRLPQDDLARLEQRQAELDADSG